MLRHLFGPRETGFYVEQSISEEALDKIIKTIVTSINENPKFFYNKSERPDRNWFTHSINFLKIYG